MMATQSIERARTFFRAAHDSINQKRKYTGAPYWVHTEEVADIVSEYTDDTAIIIAALGHDSLEDVFPANPFYCPVVILQMFGQRVHDMVFDLTDQYTKENYPTWNRKMRKQKECERLGLVHPDSQSIKLADLISNGRDILVNDVNFARTYLREERQLLPYLILGDVRLWGRAAEQCEAGLKKLGMSWDSDK